MAQAGQGRNCALLRPSTSPCTWHRSHFFASALLTLVGHVINLPAWEQDADLHGLAASSALWRVGRKARCGFLLWCHEPPLRIQAPNFFSICPEVGPHLRQRTPQPFHSLVGRSVSARAAVRCLLPTLA
jgi:hypothetical protein